MQATAIDLRFRARELLEAVRRGEQVLITYRGRPCARLVPLASAGDEPAAAREVTPPLFGIWADYSATRPVQRYVDGLRRKRS
jgi:prevent-host-death family protein